MKKYLRLVDVDQEGWFLTCPIWLTVDNEDPIPKGPQSLWWWFDVNLWVYDRLMDLACFFNPDLANGYLFWGVNDLKEITTICYEAEDCC